MWRTLVYVCVFVCCCSDPVEMAQQRRQQRHPESLQQEVKCGGKLGGDRGTISTPNFPGPFPVPIRCQWVLDTTDRVPANNYSIVVYLTQLYVTKGLTFTEFAYYEKGSTQLGRRLVHAVTEQNVTLVYWLWTRNPFLVIDFTLDQLEGNHLRVMDHLLDVYGFNITYEISGRENPVRPDACNVYLCSFLGNCYVNRDYTRFGCSCFEGFSGPKCGHGPECEADRNICQNGATCSHLGSDAVLCNCTAGYTGHRCEIALPDPEDADECGDEGCVYQCRFENGKDEVCNCPKGPPVQTGNGLYFGGGIAQHATAAPAPPCRATIAPAPQRFATAAPPPPGFQTFLVPNQQGWGSAPYMQQAPNGSGLYFGMSQPLSAAQAPSGFQAFMESNQQGWVPVPYMQQPPTDRARYEGSVRLANLSALRESVAATGHPDRAVQSLLEKQIAKFLKGSNLSKLEELRVLNITPGAEVTFHFFGGKRDGGKVREALNNLMKRGRLGNLTLVPTHLAFKQEPTLLLQSVKANQDHVVREGDEFILSCIAQGSSYMTFRWYKDGAFVNKNKTLRPMWTRLLPMDPEDRYTALLGIERASYLDEGVYTCQVVDWGQQQCKSLRMQVLVKPEVDVLPRSITVQRGETVSIKCMSPNDQHHEKFGYSWAKNKLLLKMAPGVEVWEDLHPAGSILKIYNAQKSAEYTCTVHGTVGNEALSVYVEVVNRSVVPLCPNEVGPGGLIWSETAPAMDAIQDCPAHYSGTVWRRCTLRDTHTPWWNIPDFSRCVSDKLMSIYNNFRSLSLGYENTTGPTTLADCHNLLMHNSLLYPGEGEPVLSLLQDVLSYLNHTRNYEHFLASTQTFYQIINVLLESNLSVINPQKVIQLQDLVKTEALLWGSLLTSTPNSARSDLSSIVLDVALLESVMTYNLHFPLRTIGYPFWYSDRFDIHIEGANSEAFGNGSFSFAVIVYRNLSEFLPQRYVAKLSDGNEMEYEINSKIVTVELGKETRKPDTGAQRTFIVDLELEHMRRDYDADEWNVSCGFAQAATADGNSWDLSLCITRTVSSNATRCKCSKPGTYAVLLTTRLTRLPHAVPEYYHTVVLIGCICCLVQTAVTLFLLLPYWWHHRSCIIFLKLQCCTATSGAMGVFIYAVRDSVPKTSFPYVTTSLEAFLLIGMSSHLSKLMIVYTEVVQIPKVRHMKQTVVSIITGVPVLAVLCNHLAHHSTGWQLKSWWLVHGTMLFNIFIASAVIMLVLFIFLYCTVMRRLKLLSSKNSIGNKAIVRRVGLLRRAAVIFSIMVVMEASSIFYINVPHTTCHYIFSFTSALLGFTIFLFYILKSETPHHIQVLRKLKLDTGDEEYSSESINSPLRFFTKQEGDAESEGPPPRPDSSLNLHGSSTTGPRGEEDDEGDPTEGLLMVETTSRSYQRTPPSEGAPSTIETFVHSVEGSAEECLTGSRVTFRGSGSEGKGPRNSGCSSNSKEDDELDMEAFNTSPTKYKAQPKTSRSPVDMFSEYVEKDVSLPTATTPDEPAHTGSGEQWKFLRGYYHNGIPRPEPGQCYIREQTENVPTTQQEIVTTRVCVELGVIAAPRQHHDRQGSEDPGCSVLEAAPAIVLCSVDVEPCHRSVLEMTEVTAAVETATPCCANGVTEDRKDAAIAKETVVEKIGADNTDKPDGQEIPLPSEQRMVAGEGADDSFVEVERKQPEGREKPSQPTISVTAAVVSEEDMLDRISHDLDYLLNRRPQQNNGVALTAPPSFPRKMSKPPGTTVRTQIKEEEEEDASALISGEISSPGKS